MHQRIGPYYFTLGRDRHSLPHLELGRGEVHDGMLSSNGYCPWIKLTFGWPASTDFEIMDNGYFHGGIWRFWIEGNFPFLDKNKDSQNGS